MTTRTHFMNKTLLGYLCASLVLYSSIAVKAEAAKLTITDNLILRDIDDKSVEHGFLSKKQTFELTPGKHTLIIKYKDVFEDLDFAEDRLVTSDYFVVKFTVENQQELLLSTSKINDLAAAEHFARKPELSLLDEDKKAVVLDLEKLKDYELAKQVTKVVTNLSVPIVTTQNINKASIVANSELAFNNKVLDNVDAVPMLKYWWQKANQEEKDRFHDFINENK